MSAFAHVALSLIASAIARPPAAPPRDPQARMAACRAHLSPYAGQPPGRLAEAFAVGCADLYAAPGCAEAWRAWPTVAVEARVASVAMACRQAACPELPEPRPPLCGSDAPDAATIASQWPALNRAILARDLGITPAEVDAFQFELAALVNRPLRQKPDLRIEAEGLFIYFEGGFTMLSNPIDAALLRAKLEPALAGCAQRTLVLAAGPELGVEVLEPVLDALQALGCTSVKMEIRAR